MGSFRHPEEKHIESANVFNVRNKGAPFTWPASALLNLLLDKEKAATSDSPDLRSLSRLAFNLPSTPPNSWETCPSRNHVRSWELDPLDGGIHPMFGLLSDLILCRSCPLMRACGWHPCPTAPCPRRAGQRAVERGRGMWRENSTQGQHTSRTASLLLHHRLTDSHTHSCTRFTERATEAGKDHLERDGCTAGNHRQLRVCHLAILGPWRLTKTCRSLLSKRRNIVVHKSNEVWTPGTTWMTLENIVLSERRA